MAITENDGENKVESRVERSRSWFQVWEKRFAVETHVLPANVSRANGQLSVPFGDSALQLLDTVVGCESCEELFTPKSPHIALGLGGVEILGNGSGSHHELRKLNYRVELMELATRKSGGVYLYANQRGCDGGRLYYDGSCMIFLNGTARQWLFARCTTSVLTQAIYWHKARSLGCATSKW
jgi:NAD+ synthase (glutamine-hydrolysing)